VAEIGEWRGARQAAAGASTSPALTTASAAQAVARTRQRQIDLGGCLNGELPQSQLSALARPTPAANELLEQVFERLGLTARSYHRVLRVALTIADLAQSEAIEPAHIAEAVQLRRAAGTF
jgi:magnesium chelatase family protein